MTKRASRSPERSRFRTPFEARLLVGLALPVTAALATLVLLRLADLSALSGAGHLMLALAVGVLAIALTLPWLLAPLRRLSEKAREVTEMEPQRADNPLASVERSLTELGRSTKERLRALEADREHLLAIVASMSEGVLVVDRDGKAVIVNPSWRQLFDLPEGTSGATPIELTRQTRLEQLVKRTLETGVGDQEEIELGLPQATTIIATSSALSDRSGAVIVARDITDFLRLAEIRRDFVANVSHELKTPLSAIRGLAETLKDGALEDAGAAGKFVDRILRQCKRLEALLSDLLTLSRLEHPTSGSEPELVDLGSVVLDAAEILGSTARKRDIAVEISIGDAKPISGNRDALERLALNLLENAIKYNRPGGDVSIRLKQQQDQLVLEVKDTGIGIPSSSLDRLFERFYRVDKGRSRAEGGTGLGLAIVKHATQLHAGRVEVESRLGRGTTFRVVLPLAPASEKDGTVAPL